MAYLAELSSLTDELVTLITLVSRPDAKFNVYRESSLRHLRHHSNLRTNQFDVQDQLTGWEERFRVHGREALADALHIRLESLEGYRNRWTPDILHFLLQLSDQPTQKTDLADLEALKKPQPDLEPRITWAEIAREDGWLEDRALWQRIDYAGHPDDDEADGYDETRSDVSADSASTSPSSTDKYQRTVQDFVVKEDGKVELQNVLNSQAWRHTGPSRTDDGRLQKTQVSDLHVLREVLFMLGGHPTTLFDSAGDPVPDYQLSNVAWDSFKALLSTYAERGRTLRPLREFGEARYQIPLIQVFQGAVQKHLLGFDHQLSELQARYVAPEQDAVASLTWILLELKPSFSNLSALSSIVEEIHQQRSMHPFRHLELLFEAAGEAQATGRSGVYKFLASIFFDCFQVYLRTIRLWMEEGKLVENDKTFFVSRVSTKVALEDIWNGRFKLRQTKDGVLHAPHFLQPAARRIFTTGKSINVLKQLGRYEALRRKWTGKEPDLDYNAVCSSDELDLCPFIDLFNVAFDCWIQNKHHTTSAILRQVLFESCGLTSALDHLQHMYFGCDASALDGFADSLFRHLDALSPTWKDRFTLTEIAQAAFSHYVGSYRVSAHIDSSTIVRSAAAARSSVRLSLPAVRLACRLDWPVQLILSETSIAAYQTIFTFLLQLRRGTFVLQRQWKAAGSLPTEHFGLYCLVRAKLLWFCNTLATYLTSLVLAPNISNMKEDLRVAVDVDDMINVHSAFASDALEECCLGARLQPLQDCILDIFDLTIKLEDAHRAETVKDAEVLRETSGLSAFASPVKARGSMKGSRSGVYAKAEDDEEGMEEVDDVLNRSVMGQKMMYGETLKTIHADLERHLRFISGGLRGVARATRSPAASKWNILAEMLEGDISDKGQVNC
jgi:gamma-tubulin complex component 5